MQLKTSPNSAHTFMNTHSCTHTHSSATIPGHFPFEKLHLSFCECECPHAMAGTRRSVGRCGGALPLPCEFQGSSSGCLLDNKHLHPVALSPALQLFCVFGDMVPLCSLGDLKLRLSASQVLGSQAIPLLLGF